MVIPALRPSPFSLMASLDTDRQAVKRSDAALTRDMTLPMDSALANGVSGRDWVTQLAFDHSVINTL